MVGFILTEQQVLNCIWDNPELIYKFDRNYFLSKIGSDIFDGIKEIYEGKNDIDINKLISLKNSTNSSITEEFLTKFRNKDYSLESFDFYFNNLRKQYAKEQINNYLLKDLLAESSSKDDLNLTNLENLLIKLQDSIGLIAGKKTVLKDLNNLITSYRGVLIKRKRGEYNFPTGDSFLDKHLAVGFAPGQITVIFGATGVGKSMFALNLISRQINKRIASLYISLEMDETSTMDRLVCISQKVPFHFFKMNEDNEMPEEAFKIIEEESNRLQRQINNFLFVDEPSLKKKDIESLIKEAQKKLNSEYMVITIDLATMISDFGDDAISIEQSMNFFNAVAKRLKVHFVFIVQANRSADSTSIPSIEYIDKLRPNINSIKNAHAIAERARLVLSIFRPKYYAERLFPDAPELDFMDDTLDVQILKQSNGAVGSLVKYFYDSSTFRAIPLQAEVKG